MFKLVKFVNSDLTCQRYANLKKKSIKNPMIRFKLHTIYLWFKSSSLCTLLESEYLRVRTVAKDIWDLPCLQHLLFWFHVSNYRNFRNNERWKYVLNTLASWNCFTCRNLFQNGDIDMSECLTFETAFCKKSSKFCIVWIIRFWSNFTSLW